MTSIKALKIKYIIDLLNDIKDINIKKTKKKNLIDIINNNHLLVEKGAKIKDIRQEILFYNDFINHLKINLNKELDFFTDLVKEKGITKIIIDYSNIENLILDNYYKDIKEYNNKTFKIKKMNISIDLFKEVYYI